MLTTNDFTVSTTDGRVREGMDPVFCTCPERGDLRHSILVDTKGETVWIVTDPVGNPVNNAVTERLTTNGVSTGNIIFEVP